MKATKEDKTKAFEPFDLVITVESEQEAKALFAIFNIGRNTILLKSRGREIRDAIGYEYYVEDGVIANGITREEFYV